MDKMKMDATGEDKILLMETGIKVSFKDKTEICATRRESKLKVGSRAQSGATKEVLLSCTNFLNLNVLDQEIFRLLLLRLILVVKAIDDRFKMH
ncbi:unnamed protein product [Lasius platythorax]|uniref:Uncharacterized protein n=1 Tax=Lasius platythorax TaxID=488582 RepID=A0AAV2P2T5_9HYME